MSKQSIIKLSEIEISEFLNEGFLIQKPLTNDVWLGIGFDENSSHSFFLSNFYGTNFTRFKCKQLVKTNVDELKIWIQANLKSKTKIVPFYNFDNEFSKDVEQMIHWIRKDDSLKKLVAVTRSKYEFKNNEHPISRIDELLKLNGSLYGKWANGHGFLGVSPEPLFINNDKNWMTKALAGTINTTVKNYESVLLADPKERQEHDLVIEDIKAKLKNITSEILIGDTFCIDYGKMAHLQTDIGFKSEKLAPEEIISFLSPTAALGGFPHNLVYEYLKKMRYYKFEKENRVFGGVFGLQTTEESFGLVGIRNIFWTPDGAEIHSGCGVVEKSVPENEVAEVLIKRNAIESIFL